MKRILLSFSFFGLVLLTGSVWAADDAAKINPRHFGELAILHEGRIKPIDSFARHLLLQLSGRSSYEGKSALEWVMRLMLDPGSVRDDKVFMINHPETVQAAMIKADGRRRFSFAELMQGYSKLEGLAIHLSSTVEAKDLTLVEREIIRVTNNMIIYMNAAQAFAGFQRSDEFKVTALATRELLGLEADDECCSYADIVLRAQLMSEVVARLDKVDARTWNALEQDVFRIINNVYKWKSTVESDVLKILPLEEDGKLDWLTPTDAARFCDE